MNETQIGVPIRTAPRLTAEAAAPRPGYPVSPHQKSRQLIHGIESLISTEFRQHLRPLMDG